MWKKVASVQPNCFPYFCPAIRVSVVFYACLFSFEVSLVKHALAVFDLTLVDCWANLRLGESGGRQQTIQDGAEPLRANAVVYILNILYSTWSLQCVFR